MVDKQNEEELEDKLIGGVVTGIETTSSHKGDVISKMVIRNDGETFTVKVGGQHVDPLHLQVVDND